jgi:hypothetical protein
MTQGGRITYCPFNPYRAIGVSLIAILFDKNSKDNSVEKTSNSFLKGSG